MGQCVGCLKQPRIALFPGPDPEKKQGANMTDKEFKRLTRPQLIDIIYQLQLKEEELIAENKKLQEQLESKRIRMEQVGNIAEAALEVNNVMQAAQSAAEQYLKEIRLMREEAEDEKQRLLEEARKEAAAILAKAQDCLDTPAGKNETEQENNG